MQRLRIRLDFGAGNWTETTFITNFVVGRIPGSHTSYTVFWEPKFKKIGAKMSNRGGLSCNSEPNDQTKMALKTEVNQSSQTVGTSQGVKICGFLRSFLAYEALGELGCSY